MYHRENSDGILLWTMCLRQNPTVPALPGCISQGKTEGEAKKNIAEAIELHLSALAEDGVPIEYREGVNETFVAVHI